MGHTILLQWTYNPPQRTAPLNEYILTRILEHYGLSQPIRTTVQLRTFRAAVDTSTRLLTTLAYSPPVLPGRETPSQPRDNTTFIIIDDRPAVNGPEPTVDQTIKPAAPAQFSSIAVRPAAHVLPLLTNLLSPFVMGLTKSARAAASTTAEIPRPTTLPGTPLAITSLTFSPPSAPHPPVTLTIHNLPSQTAASIFLEAECETEEVLRDFLAGCLPEGVGGDVKYMGWDGEESSWEGLERTRKASQMLVRLLRESGLT